MSHSVAVSIKKSDLYPPFIPASKKQADDETMIRTSCCQKVCDYIISTWVILVAWIKRICCCSKSTSRITDVQTKDKSRVVNIRGLNNQVMPISLPRLDLRSTTTPIKNVPVGFFAMTKQTNILQVDAKIKELVEQGLPLRSDESRLIKTAEGGCFPATDWRRACSEGVLKALLSPILLKATRTENALYFNNVTLPEIGEAFVIYLDKSAATEFKKHWSPSEIGDTSTQGIVYLGITEGDGDNFSCITFAHDKFQYLESRK